MVFKTDDTDETLRLKTDHTMDTKHTRKKRTGFRRFCPTENEHTNDFITFANYSSELGKLSGFVEKPLDLLIVEQT